MRSARRLSLTVLVLALVAGCAAPVRFEYNSAPYAQWRSYTWLTPKAQPVRNPVVDSGILATRVQQAVAAVLGGAGYTQVADPAQADFLVTYLTTLQKQERSNPSVGFSYGWWGNPWGATIVSQPNYQVQQADLIIDVIDAKTNQLVWRGWVTNSLSQSNYSQQAVDAAVKRILSKFPPPPKGSS
jgi:Domain of unknown function (DUF4136)